MAISSDSIIRCHQKIFAKHPILELENGVFRVAVGARGVSCSTRKLRSKARVGVRPLAEASVEGLKNFEGDLDFGLDAAAERELTEKGFSGMRKTKLVCTIGPACCSLEDLERLARGGMNVARLNMCHNTKEWHRDVIRKIKRLNDEKGFCVSVMIDTEGSQIHVVDHGAPSSLKAEVSKILNDPTFWFVTYFWASGINYNVIINLSLLNFSTFLLVAVDWEENELSSRSLKLVTRYALIRVHTIIDLIF